MTHLLGNLFLLLLGERGKVVVLGTHEEGDGSLLQSSCWFGLVHCDMGQLEDGRVRREDDKKIGACACMHEVMWRNEKKGNSARQSHAW